MYVCMYIHIYTHIQYIYTYIYIRVARQAPHKDYLRALLKVN